MCYCCYERDVDPLRNLGGYDGGKQTKQCYCLRLGPQSNGSETSPLSEFFIVNSGLIRFINYMNLVFDMMTIMMMFKRINKGSRRILHVVPVSLPFTPADDCAQESHHGHIRGHAGHGGLSHGKKMIVSFNSGRTQVGDETNYTPAAIHLRREKRLTLGNDGVRMGAAAEFTSAFKSGHDNQSAESQGVRRRNTLI